MYIKTEKCIKLSFIQLLLETFEFDYKKFKSWGNTVCIPLGVNSFIAVYSYLECESFIFFLEEISSYWVFFCFALLSGLELKYL